MTTKPANIIERKLWNRQDRAGAVTVEFAFVAPIIFLVFFGAVEIANLNFLRNLANDTAFQVAREAIVPGAKIATIEADAMEFLANNGISNASIVTSDIAGNLIEVEVTIPIDENSWGLGQLTPGRSIVQTCELAKQLE